MYYHILIISIDSKSLQHTCNFCATTQPTPIIGPKSKICCIQPTHLSIIVGLYATIANGRTNGKSGVLGPNDIKRIDVTRLQLGTYATLNVLDASNEQSYGYESAIDGLDGLAGGSDEPIPIIWWYYFYHNGVGQGQMK